MADFPALPLWTDALAADTDHLTHEEYGLYQRMLNVAWRSPGCDLPNDPTWIRRRFRLSEEDFSRIGQPIIDEFWHVTKRGRLEQKRLTKERAYVSEKSAKQRTKAVTRWNKTKTDDAVAMPRTGTRHGSGNAPTPTPTPIDKKEENTRQQQHSTISRETAAAAAADPDKTFQLDPRFHATAIACRNIMGPEFLGDTGLVNQWLADGCEPDPDIYPTMTRLIEKRNGERPSSLSYFTAAVQEARRSRTTPLQEHKGNGAGNPRQRKHGSGHEAFLRGAHDAAVRHEARARDDED